MRHSAFQFSNCTSVAPGELRLTRLNIYSGIYLEWAAARIVIDPAKLIPDLVSQLQPDLILVSHESMDHFDPDLCLRWLRETRTMLVGSWGTIAALAAMLPSSDARWSRIYAAVPGAEFQFGDLSLRIHSSLHCEYASPVFFELIDTCSSWRLIDLIDTAMTEGIASEKLSPNCDLLILPLGIALGASPKTAWEFVERLRPLNLMPGHFNADPSAFVKLASPTYPSDGLHICQWHEGVTLTKVGNPKLGETYHVSGNSAFVLAPANSSEALPTFDGIDSGDDLINCLYYATWATLLHGPSAESEERLLRLHNECLDNTDERLAAAYLLALGVTLAKHVTSDAATLAPLLGRLDPARPYYSYWILECCGRASENPANREMVAQAFDRIAANSTLFASEPIRRKFMWEVFRLVQFGHRWPGLNAILWKTVVDPNPDVRLLAFKTLPFCTPQVPAWRDLLAKGNHDPHEDVLEWVINAWVDLLPLAPANGSGTLHAQLPTFLTHDNYHVRLRSNVLAEMATGGNYGRAARA